MNILLLGSGGREHAFAHKLTESVYCDNLFVAPGNAGTGSIAKNINIDVLDFTAIKEFVIENDISLVVVGPEVPLVEGIVDFLEADERTSKVNVVGPSKAGALLEGSKGFAKEFMQRHNIPTARHRAFSSSDIEEAILFLDDLNAPYVLKADGLAAGKGVVILNSKAEAILELKDMLLGKKFGNASERVVIEEFLDGIELSCFVLTDGVNYKVLPFAKDYKKIGVGDTGANTGGMGAITPVPFADNEFIKKIEYKIIRPTILGLKSEGITYRGFVFIGLIKVGDEPYVIEYNVRMGDPESEVVLPILENDLVSLLVSLFDGSLSEQRILTRAGSAATVVVVSGGYPNSYSKGKVISGLKCIPSSPTETIIFHAGTALKDEKIITAGGRVLAVTSFGENLKTALDKSYSTISKINFEDMYYRNDIGFEFESL